MRLGIKTIKNFANVNSFDYTSEWNIRQEDSTVLYFQIVDLDQDGLRYLPTDASYSVSVTFPGTTIVKVATQANSLDRSIWGVQINTSDKVLTGNIQVSVTEGSVVKKFSVLQAITVESLNGGGC
jgi:hypothetical protein